MGVLFAGCAPGREEGGATASRAAERKPEATGTLGGRIGYPSDMPPPMTIYVMKASGEPETWFLHTAWDQRRYSIDLPPGRYFVFAIPDERTDSLVVGAHTEFSPCNARQIRGEQPDPPCATSPPREVVVRAGARTDDADIDDWFLTEDMAMNLNALARGAREHARTQGRP